jgi:hypothetical protein
MVFRIMEARSPAQLTVVLQLGPVVWNTVTLEDAPEGGTRVISRYRFELPAGAPVEMRAGAEAMVRQYERVGGELIARLIEEGAAAAAPA